MPGAWSRRVKDAEVPTVVATVTDEQFAARALVRDWARNASTGPGGTAAIRDVEQGNATT